ncbi:MAG: Do family serine endopeptidase [Alphaproteobacteria bacterium]|nr:Do family serine endopeptidase [Alphaproteobacteria bacterium]
MKTILGAVLAAGLLAALPLSASAQTAVPQSMGQVQMTFAPVVKKVIPAVVNVYTRTVVQQQVNPVFADPFFQRFFGVNPQFRDRVQQSLGSGVIVRSDGLVITNNHVIDGAQDIVVALSDKREFKARVVQADKRIDLAVLKIETKGEKLPVISFGDSDKLQVGDLVLAVGDPFGVGQTVTMGIVSALARTQVSASDYQFFIQTDAAVNPGNSGGALVTTDGKLAGINTMIYSRTGGSVGIGFAIPANLVRRFVDGANSGGVKFTWFGADGQAVTSDIARSLGVPPNGVLLKNVYKDGPAADAGLKVGDIVLAVDGYPVDDMQALNYRIAVHKAGDAPSVKVRSNGQVRDVSVTLEVPPETTPRDARTIGGRNPLTGARVENLSPATATDLGLDPDASGVVIVGIAPNTLAARYGFQAGDAIRGVNGQRIDSVGDLEQALAAARGRWDLAVERNGQILRLSVSG